VRQDQKSNLLQGVKVGRHNVEVCMLQFADDTLFLCEDDYGNVIVIKAILRCYELASGLKIKFRKSNMVDINVERNSFAFFAMTFELHSNDDTFYVFGDGSRR